MKKLRNLTLISAFFLMIIGSSCGPASAQPTLAPAPVQPTQAAEVEPTSIPATQAPEPALEPTKDSASQEPAFMDFDPNNFENSTNIDNHWSPMKPGMHWVYDGTIVDEGEIIPHRIEFTVSDLTKEIQDVQTIVIWSEDYTGGKLVEKEIAFYAQDNDGRIWYFGEYPEEYENDKFVKAPAWIAGIQGARAGVKMEANPQLGMPGLFQGWGPAVEWSDYGHVDQMGLKVCVPLNCYNDVLVVAESSLGEKGAFQLKYFAPEVGEVEVGWKGTDVNQEELVLTEYKLLNPQELAKIHAMVLSLEKHAYEVSQDVYGQTSPMEYPVGTPAIDASEIPVAEPTQSSAAVESSGSDIIVYASDLPQSALSELDFIDDPASPGGKLIGLPNNGDELDPPPENDPHTVFKVQVQSGSPYRCWIHMRVGSPKGVSKANVIWVQFSNAVDESNKEILKPGSGSYLTAEGPTQEGWTWVECDRADSDADSLVYFGTSGEVTVRLQAGAEGVGFDQFMLSPAEFLNTPPTDPIVDK